MYKAVRGGRRKEFHTKLYTNTMFSRAWDLMFLVFLQYNEEQQCQMENHKDCELWLLYDIFE